MRRCFPQTISVERLAQAADDVQQDIVEKIGLSCSSSSSALTAISNWCVTEATARTSFNLVHHAMFRRSPVNRLLLRPSPVRRSRVEAPTEEIHDAADAEKYLKPFVLALAAGALVWLVHDA
jgi:hypothetical protein